MHQTEKTAVLFRSTSAEGYIAFPGAMGRAKKLTHRLFEQRVILPGKISHGHLSGALSSHQLFSIRTWNFNTSNFTNMVSYDIASRAQALTLKLLNFTNEDIERMTGMNRRTVSRYVDKAVERGLDLNARPLLILDRHVENGVRTGRPKKQPPQDAEEDSSKVGTD